MISITNNDEYFNDVSSKEQEQIDAILGSVLDVEDPPYMASEEDAEDASPNSSPNSNSTQTEEAPKPKKAKKPLLLTPNFQ